MLPRTIFAHKQSPASRGPLVLRAGTVPRPASSIIIRSPVSSHAQFPIYEDTKSTHHKLEQKRHSWAEGVKDAEFRESVESTEGDLAQLGPRSLNELTSSQVNTRGYVTEPYSLGNSATEYILPVQPARYQDGSENVIQMSSSSLTPSFGVLPTCHACDLRINTAYAPGVSWPQCTHFGCLYCNLPFDPRVPSLNPLSVGEMPIASDYWSHAPSVPLPSLQDHQLRYTYTSPSNQTRSTEAVSALSSHAPFQGTGSFVQAPSAHCTDSSNVNFIGNQMNINFFSGHPPPQSINECRLQQHNDTILQGRYLDTTEAMNTSTPQIFPNPNLRSDGSEAQAMDVFTPQAESYALPVQNDFEWQNTAIPDEEFDMLLFQQNDPMKDGATYSGREFEGQHQI